MRDVSVSSIKDRIQKHMRAMPNSPAQHTLTGVTVMKAWKQENEGGVGASFELLKSLNESGCPPHMLKLWAP